jgi:hypothetical protein
MAKRHPVINSQFMKAIRDVHSFFQEESFKIRNNQQLLPHKAIIERVCDCLKVSPLAYEYKKYVENRFYLLSIAACILNGKWPCCYSQYENIVCSVGMKV